MRVSPIAKKSVDLTSQNNRWPDARVIMKIFILYFLSILNFPHSNAPERGSIEGLERVKCVKQFIKTVHV